MQIPVVIEDWLPDYIVSVFLINDYLGLKLEKIRMKSCINIKVGYNVIIRIEVRILFQ